MLKKITVNASDLAKITGHNKFETIDIYVDKLLSKNGIIQKYIPKTNIERHLLSLKSAELNSIKKELKLDKTVNISEIELSLKKLIKCVNQEKTEDKSKSLLQEKLKETPLIEKLLKQSIEKDTRITRGNIRENSALNKTQTKINMNIVERNSKFYSRELFRSDKCIINLLGKIDGMINENNVKKIVETKNRRNKLFGTIPMYEKVQLEAYMYLTNLESSIHIENYNESQNIQEYEHNNEFWSECLTKTKDFMKEYVEIHL